MKAILLTGTFIRPQLFIIATPKVPGQWGWGVEFKTWLQEGRRRPIRCLKEALLNVEAGQHAFTTVEELTLDEFKTLAGLLVTQQVSKSGSLFAPRRARVPKSVPPVGDS